MVSCTVPALTKTLALIDFLIANGTKSDVIRVFLGVRNQILLPCAAIKGACRPPASRKQKKSSKEEQKYGETSHFCDIFGTGLCGR